MIIFIPKIFYNIIIIIIIIMNTFFLIELSNLKLSKELTKSLRKIRKTIFNIVIKPPTDESNSKKLLHFLSKTSFF